MDDKMDAKSLTSLPKSMYICGDADEIRPTLKSRL
jgi:hypothetical protein